MQGTILLNSQKFLDNQKQNVIQISSWIILPHIIPKIPVISKMYLNLKAEKQREICQTTMCAVHATTAVINSTRTIFFEGILNYKDLSQSCKFTLGIPEKL